MKTRKCRTCSEHKPLSQMAKNTRSRDGVISFCKACAREQDYFRNNGVKRPKSLDVYKLIAGVEHKRCPECSEYKTYDNFHRTKKENKGVAAGCKSCRNIWTKQRYTRSSDGLEDKYIRKLLSTRSKLKMSEFPQELVDVQREVIRIQRFIKENNV